MVTEPMHRVSKRVWVAIFCIVSGYGLAKYKRGGKGRMPVGGALKKALRQEYIQMMTTITLTR